MIFLPYNMEPSHLQKAASFEADPYCIWRILMEPTVSSVKSGCWSEFIRYQLNGFGRATL